MDTFQMQQQIAALAFAGTAKDTHLSAWTTLRLGNRLVVQENAVFPLRRQQQNFLSTQRWKTTGNGLGVILRVREKEPGI